MSEATNHARVQALVENHRAFLAFLERRVGDRATAEDLLHDAFVRSLDKAENVRREESVQAWFYRMLRNAVIDHHRRLGVADRKLAALAAELEEAVEPPRETREVVCGCLGKLADTLPASYSDAIRKVDLEEMPLQAFAASQGITPNNAAVRLHRARAALRKRLVECCGTCADHGCLNCTCSG